ncbi:MAG: hypothetical protein II393_03655 [Cytophagales bacterium]|nr:hypothetical protein [Cytophagales bacterium]
MLVQKKTVISNVIFTILFSYYTLSNAQYDKSFKSKFPTGNAFVKFFKYGKHSVLYKGLSARTVAELVHYYNPPKGCQCFPTIADFILYLFCAQWECRYRYKPLYAIYFNCSSLGDYSFYDFLNESCFYIINPNFGISYTLLHNESFSWRTYAGVGVMWGASSFKCHYPYMAVVQIGNDEYKQLQKDYRLKGKFIDLLKEYFSSKNICNNLKHFDVIIDLSAFDFIIKNHVRISLAWKCGVANFYKVILDTEKKFSRKIIILGLNSLSLSVGYQF